MILIFNIKTSKLNNRKYINYKWKTNFVKTFQTVSMTKR